MGRTKPHPTTFPAMDRDQNFSVTVTNENWKGKNDPTERRRIQNRINQRAFRQRQREGESPKQYRTRATSSDSPEPQLAIAKMYAEDHDNSTCQAQPRCQTDGRLESSEGHRFDLLACLINRNFHAAASSNARHLGISQSAVHSTSLTLTPTQHANSSAGLTLQPVTLQHQILHDPIIDILPHARLRHNIMMAIAASRIDAKLLCDDLRCSGGLICIQGSWQRCGLVLWGSPQDSQSWEISAGFMYRWGHFLQGCEDLLASTNVWRAQRGEPCFQH